MSNSNNNPSGEWKNAIKMGVWMIAVLIALTIAIVGIPALTFLPLPSTAEIQTGMIIVLAVGILIVLLYLMTSGFSLLRLANPREALGLPEGSIRALIALFYIMIFIIVGIYLFRAVAGGTGATLENLTSAQVIELGERVMSVQQNVATFDVTLNTGDTQENLTSAQVIELGERAINVQPDEITFDVTLRTGTITEAGEQMALQIVTILGTLVAAISAFYFGYRVAEVSKQTETTALSIDSIEPPKGLNTTKVEGVLLKGTGFVDATQVKLRKQGQPDTDSVVSKRDPTSLICTFDLTGKVTGKWDVVVINPDGSRVIKEAAFEVQAPQLPVSITSINPDTGSNQGKVVHVLVAGTGFVDKAEVKLTKDRDEIVGEIAIVTSTLIVCNFDLAGKPQGLWNVVVTNPGGTSVQKDNLFTVT